MPIDVNRPSDTAKSKIKLSKLGIASVLLLALLLAVGTFMILSGRQRSKQLAENAAIIDAAISHAVAVCQNVAVASGDYSGANLISEFMQSVEAEKDPLKKADMTVELIGSSLRMAADRQDLTDELNGARNRLLIAIREYKSL